MIKFLAGYVVGCFILFSLIVMIATPNSNWQGKVIERGYGLYCPSDGAFAFVGECTDD
jgi:hypothetical protein